MNRGVCVYMCVFSCSIRGGYECTEEQKKKKKGKKNPYAREEEDTFMDGVAAIPAPAPTDTKLLSAVRP